MFAIPGPTKVPSGADCWFLSLWDGCYFLSGLLVWVVSGSGDQWVFWSSRVSPLGFWWAVWPQGFWAPVLLLGPDKVSGRAESFSQNCGLGYSDQERRYCWQKAGQSLRKCWQSVGGVLPGVPGTSMASGRAGWGWGATRVGVQEKSHPLKLLHNIQLHGFSFINHIHVIRLLVYFEVLLYQKCDK